MTLLRDQRLRVFHAVATHSGFSRAAGHLGLTQQAVSLQIRSLEREVGTRLFTRGHRTTSLTPAGRTLFAHAERILALYAQANESLTAIARSAQPTLRIAATHSIAKYRLPRLMSRFHERDATRILLEVGNSRHVVERLHDGRVDVAISSAGAPDPGRLETTPCFRDPLVFVVAPDHPWADQAVVTLQDLQAAPLIAREEGSSTRALLQRRLHTLGLSMEQMNITLTAGNPEAAKAAAQAGLGVAILSSLCARDALASGRLIAKRIASLSLTRDFYLASHKAASPPPAVGHFITVARQALA
ncbi:LysR family transcriptional regulator [Modicisalibacter coralii]|uniref:LysR family transcriptional regulator n=1 Tax=Modicisalibacter coralii TaxID=2304602 RepID=UPI0013969603|nr:LysR family transcriptional regulator [Halomonas coralii]